VLITACGINPQGTHTIVGTSTHGTVADLSADDNLYYTTGASCTGAFAGCKTDWYGIFNVGQGNIPDLRVKYIGKNAGAGWQFISVWNWATMSWLGVDAFRVVAGNEVTVEKALPPSGDFLTSKGIGFVRVTTVGNMTSSSADVLLGCTEFC
jgi:hypothetical protein